MTDPMAYNSETPPSFPGGGLELLTGSPVNLVSLPPDQHSGCGLRGRLRLMLQMKG